MTKFLLPLLCAFAIHAAAQISPQDSANMDAARDKTTSGFITDTNRTYPILFLVGDSTVHNLSRGERSWGDLIGKYFDQKKIRVENHALGGRSSRTYITQGWWDKVLTNAKPGDYVLIQMGHNDGGRLDDTNRARGSIRGLGEDTKDIFNPVTQKPETVHTYGWYLRKYINDARAKGMTPILCTPIPHCPTTEVHAGDIEKWDFVRLATAVAENEKVLFINLNQIVMSHYAGMPPKEIKEKYFTPADNTHTSLAGGELNAECVIEGLRKLNCPLNNDLVPESAVKPTTP
jgi:rhamnogalacturonan acetylesterase